MDLKMDFGVGCQFWGAGTRIVGVGSRCGWL